MDAESLKELFREFAAVAVRRMFGGQGVFVDGLMIALVADDVIYLKADEETVPGFERAGMKPFSYTTKDGKRTLTSYWRMPDFLYDDPGDLALWARAAHGVALRADERKRTPTRARQQIRTKKRVKTGAKSRAKRLRVKAVPKRKKASRKAVAAKSKRRR